MKKPLLALLFVLSSVAFGNILDFALPDAKVSQKYQEDLRNHISKGSAYKYYIVDGPSWASLTEMGIFSGIPKASDVGQNSFEIQYCNATVCALDTANVLVK